MDLPKELLQKYLSPQKQDSAKSQRASAARVEQSRISSVKGVGKVKKIPAVLPNAPESTVVAEEDALFMEAMLGMVRKSSEKKISATHGAFPLPMPESIATAPLGRIDDIMVEGTGSGASNMATGKVGTGTTSKPIPSVQSGGDSENAFALAMRTVQPLKGKGRDVLPPVVAMDATVLQNTTPLAKDIVFDVHMSGESVQGQVVGLDSKMLTSLASGSQSPEARLDLHGMNAAQAFQALVPFFKSSWHKGLRIIIVVTGRGINSPTGMAVLRQKLAAWLTQAPFNQVVMAFSTAQPCDGGTGSMYVLLRKFRKKHPVCWERTPVDSDIF